MKYDVYMSSGAIYIPSFIKIGPGIHELMGGFTDNMVVSYFFKIRKVSQKIACIL
jgi:hypothetical protein